MADDRISSTENILSEAALLAFITAAAYYLAFQHEAAFIGYFGVPRELVQVEIQSLILMAASIATVLLLFAPLAQSILAMVPAQNERLKPFVLRWGAMLLLIPISISAIGVRNWRQWILIVASVSTLAALELLPPLLAKLAGRARTAEGEGGTYLEHWGALQDKRRDRIRESMLHGLLGPLGLNVTRILLILLFLNVIATATGLYNARTQRDFLVLRGTPERVVLRIYGSRAITAPLLRRDRLVQKQYRFVNLDESDTAILSLERVGPLSVKLEKRRNRR